VSHSEGAVCRSSEFVKASEVDITGRIVSEKMEAYQAIAVSLSLDIDRVRRIVFNRDHGEVIASL
jgi:hypothetical protein